MRSRWKCHVWSLEGKRPNGAEYIFCIFLAPETCEAVVGDLEERFDIIAANTTMNRALLWYWRQVITSLAPLASARIQMALCRRIGS